MARVVFLFLIFFSALTLNSLSQNTWTGTNSNSWSDSGNWSTGEVPGTAEEVIINSGIVNINTTPNPVIGSLTMTGGTLDLFSSLSLTINGISNIGSGASLDVGGTLILNDNITIDGTLILGDNGISGSGDLIINGNFNWNSSSSTVEITGQFVNNGSINITGAQLKTTLDNQGTVNQNGTFFINDNGKYINNGTHDVQDNSDITEGGTNLGMTNNGTLVKSGGTSRSDIQPDYDGSGSVEAQIGTIDFRNTSIQSGTLISSGGSIRFPTKTHTFSGVSIQGTGMTEVNGGTITVNADVTATNLKISSGEIGGAGKLTVTNSMVWSAGQLGNTVDTGEIIISGTFSIEESGTKALGTQLTTSATTIWSGGAWLLHNNAILVNDGTFDIQTDSDMDGSSRTIINNGTLTKSSGTFTTFLNPEFTNNGTISVESGTLRLFNGSNSGTITTTSGATLDFSGSSSTFTNESGGTIGGTGEITIGGNLVNNGSLSPGTSPGILTIPSAVNLTLGTTSTIDLEVGGTTVGTEYDQMDLTGTFALDGTLNVSLINAFTPNIGDCFDLIKYTDHTGQLAAINLPTTAGLSFDITDENGLIKLTISEENIAPILDNSADIEFTAIDEDNTDSSGDLISNIEMGTGITLIVDPNGPVEGIAVVATDNSNGSWQFTLNNGTTWMDFGAPSISNARLLLRDASTRIRFVPDANFNGVVSSGITFHAWDQWLGASAGSTADGSTNGGITPFSSTSETISISINPVNDTPSLSNPVADQQTNEDETYNFVVPTNTFEDIDTGDALTLAAALSDDSSLPSWLTFDGSSFSGTPTNAEVGVITIKLTATDGSSESISDEFTLEIINTNDVPTLSNPVADQQTNEDETYNFAVPTNTFEDVDAGDALTFTATLSDDSPLPGWSTFDGSSISGTPTNDEVGVITIKLTATDGSGESISDEFTLEVINTNDVPTLSNPVSDQQTNEDETYNFAVPTNTFEDVDAGDILTLSAALSDDSALPTWLTFDGTAFSGTPTNDEVGTVIIKLTATDGSSLSVSDEFNLEVINLNDAPVLDNELIDQNIEGGKEFSFSFPENTFSDVDVDDVLTYSATLSDDSALPAWLNFDGQTRTFSGTPDNADAVYSIKVTAADLAQVTAADEFDLTVSLILGLQNAQQQFQIMTAPNPFIDQYRLKLKNTPIGQISIEIFDSVGRKIYNNRFVSNSSNHTQFIDMSNQLSGIYVLTITHPKGSQSSRIVKK